MKKIFNVEDLDIVTYTTVTPIGEDIYLYPKPSGSGVTALLEPIIVDGKTFTKRLATGGTAKTSQCSINTFVEGKCKLKVIARGQNATEQAGFKIMDEFGATVYSTNVPLSSEEPAIVEYNFSEDFYGSIWFGGATKGVQVFYVELTDEESQEPTTMDYIEALKRDRSNLVINLNSKGIPATIDETFTQLVPKVLDIPSAEGAQEIVNIIIEGGE